MMIDPQIQAAIISMLGGIVATLLGVELNKRRIRKARKSTPDRIDMLFDRYEKTIHELDTDNQTLRVQIKETDQVIDKLQDDLYDAKRLINQMTIELDRKTQAIDTLTTEIKALRRAHATS